jgi:hypothetical protein
MAGGDPITEQANELNRILGAGRAGWARVKGHVDTGEQVEGNPVWVFQLEVTPENGPPYLVQHREIVSAAAIAGYPDGALLACRIDPEDPALIAFGDRPFL